MVWGCCETHQLPRDELKRFVKETPFTSREVLKLWSRYSRLDKDRSGRLSLQVPDCTIYLVSMLPTQYTVTSSHKLLALAPSPLLPLTGDAECGRIQVQSLCLQNC